MKALSNLWNSIQSWLFPHLEGELGELSERDRNFIRVVESTQLECLIRPYKWKGLGRKSLKRLCIAKAFIAQKIYKIGDRKSLVNRLHRDVTLRRLCGWETEREIPSEATFCRAFQEFSEGELPQKIHQVMIEDHAKEKLFGHMSRDSTPIEAREKPKKKAKAPVDSKPKKRGRPKKGEKRKKTPRRLELQGQRSLDENLEDLPKQCDVGTKRDSKGKKRSWVGYKLHIDSVDGDIPVSCVVTSASLHDSQVAIPLAQMTKDRIDNLYDLMDSAYDAPEIHRFSRELGHIPIIDHNKRRGEKIEFDPAKAMRYNQRSAVERVNSNLKDNYIPSKIRVRGPVKVITEIMFGIVALTANQLYKLLI